MAKRVNISTARNELASLFDRVIGHEGEKVVIRRRDGEREAVLVSRDYVERLEVASRSPAFAKPFRLLGSARLTGDAETIIDEIRAAETREVEKRLQEFASPPKRKPRRS